MLPALKFGKNQHVRLLLERAERIVALDDLADRTPYPPASRRRPSATGRAAAAAAPRAPSFRPRDAAPSRSSRTTASRCAARRRSSARSGCAAYAICASCSAVGSMFTVVSAQKITCFSNTSMYMPLTSPAFGCAPITSSAGRIVSGIVQVHAGHERVGVAAADHARAEIVAVVQPAARFVEAHALSLAALPHVLRVLLAPRRRRTDPRSRCRRAECSTRARLRSIVVAVAEQDRLGDAFLDADARGADDLRLFALGEHDALRIRDRRD